MAYEGPKKGKSPSGKLNSKGAGGAGQNQTFYFPRFFGFIIFGFLPAPCTPLIWPYFASFSSSG